MPKISIIMPVYNVEKYLRECLDSIIAQTVTDWECICVDDDSTDSSLAIMQEYAAKDRRFTAIHSEHANAGHARNVGLERATGEYLSFLDSDDVFAPRMFESLLEVASLSHSDVVSYNRKDFLDGKQLPVLSDSWDKAGARVVDNPAVSMNPFKSFTGMACEKLFRGDLIRDNNIRFQEIHSSNDARFTYVALCLAKRVTMLDAIFFARRLHGDSLEATRSKGIECRRMMQESFLEEMTSRGVFPSNEKLLKNFKLWCLHIFIWYIDTIDGTDAFIAAFQSLKKANEELELMKLLNEHCDGNPDELELLRLLKNDVSALDYAILRIAQTRREWSVLKQEADIRVARVEQALPCRIGLAVSWLPNKIRAILKRRRQVKKFDASCK